MLTRDARSQQGWCVVAEMNYGAHEPHATTYNGNIFVVGGIMEGSQSVQVEVFTQKVTTTFPFVFDKGQWTVLRPFPNHFPLHSIYPAENGIFAVSECFSPGIAITLLRFVQ